MIRTERSDVAYSLLLVLISAALMLLWPGLIPNLLTSQGLMPHGHCYLWNPPLVSLHVVSDSLIGLAYVSISATLVYLVTQARQSIPFHWVFLAFGGFIVACGATHFMEVWTLWQPLYWLSGNIKLITAIVSVATALILPPLVPKILKLIENAQLSEKRRLELEAAHQLIQQRSLELEQINQSLQEQIVERQQVEASLRQSESALRSYFELSLIGIGISAPDKSYLEVNDKLCEMLGYSREELCQMSWAEITYPDDIQADLTQFNRILAGESEGYSLEKRYICKDGAVIHASVSIRCLRKPDGTVDYLVGLVQDITERKQAEEERLKLAREHAARVEAEAAAKRAAFLAEAGSRLSASLEESRILATLVQLSVPALADYCVVHLMNREHQLQWIPNQSVERELGTAPEGLSQVLQQSEALQLPVLEQVLQTRKVQLLNLDLPPLQSGQSSPLLQDSCQCCSSQLAIHVPLFSQDQALGVITFVTTNYRDYRTVDLLLAEELGHRVSLAIENSRLYRQVQEANRLKDQFLAIVSHELRTPLNAILGWSQLLCTRKFDSSTTARALETIERNARLQVRLVEDLLEVSRILRGQVRLALNPMHLVPVLETAINAVRPEIETKGLRLTFNCENPLSLISGDSHCLHQVISNLLSNAIKFTPTGGQIGVSLTQTATHAKLQVQDTGVGIDPDFLPHVFDYFRQADSSTTRSYGGLGLGMAISRQLVEAHQGSIQVESPGLGQGTTFTVLLPLFNLPGQAIPHFPELGDRSCNGLRQLQVLVVDDEADSRELLQAILEEHGAQVVTVDSARAALSALEEFQPHLLLSDIGMPDQDGYVLIEILRHREQRQGEPPLPAIALTAYASSEDRQRVLSAGFQAHLAKPIEVEILMQAIANLSLSSGASSSA